jgi:hypothetical protein
MGFIDLLEEIVYGDTSYIQKLEAWRQALAGKCDDLDALLGVPGSVGSLVPPALLEIFDRRGIIGEASYKPVAGTLTGPSYNLTVALGASITAAGALFRKTSATTISLLGFSTGTLYVNLTGTGTPVVVDTADTTTVWQFAWDASTHVVSAVTLYAGVAILIDGDDWANLLVSVAKGKTFTNLADRIEELEVYQGGVQAPASADTINLDWGGSLRGHARIILDRAETTVNMTGGMDGGKYTLELIQDVSGGRAVVFGAEVQAGTDFTLPAALSVAGDKRDFLGFFFSDDGAGGNGKYNYVSLSRGY